MKNALAKISFLMICLAVLGLTGRAGDDDRLTSRPKDGYVPDKETAIRIAEAVWLPIYGKTVEYEKPFKASLSNEVWTVTGTLPLGVHGGTALAEISKSSGCILQISHGR